jgi:hypothetical protein
MGNLTPTNKKQGGNKMTKISIHLISTCLYCEKEIPFSQNMKGKLLCSLKCMHAINKAIKEDMIEKNDFRTGFGYDKSDVIKKPSLYKRSPIKKQTEADKVRREGRA